ncbi:MAG: hypothetical protein AB7G12_12115 [Thermoanaerobaculia bacterium]
MTEPVPTPIVACSIVANNYLAHAAVFARSYVEHHPGARVVVAVADRPHPAIDYDRFPFQVVFAHDLGIPDFASVAFRYDIIELSTAIKPWLFAWLRDRLGATEAVYFDPDILVTDRLDELERFLRVDGAQAVLTPHVTHPLDDIYRPSDRMIRMAGVYNLGFVGLRLDDSTAPFLGWWQDRLKRFCLIDPHHGLFVDQSWMDFAPALLDRVTIHRSPRCNVAYWNLAQRRFEHDGARYLVDGEPLGFFHFSGVDLGELSTLSRHQDRVTLEPGSPAGRLLRDYRDRVLAEGYEGVRGVPYGYERFLPDGPRVTKSLRRNLLRLDPFARRFTDPFDTAGDDSFFAWLRQPIRFARGTLTRAALAAWESDPELVRRFPSVGHHDLVDFVDWIRSPAGRRSAGVPGELLEGVALAEPDAEPAAEPPYQQEPLRVFLRLTSPEAPGRLTDVVLGEPLGASRWLLDPFPGAGPSKPWLTHLAIFVWQRERGLQRAFPRPLDEDADGLASWLAGRGADLLGLDASMVAELRRLLPVELLELVVPEPELDRGAATDPEYAGATEAVVREAPQPRIGKFGVLVVGPMRSENREALLAKEAAALLGEMALPSDVLDLDTDLLGNTVDGLFAPPTGAPWPVVLAFVQPRLAPWRLGWLPAASTQGGRRVGYLDAAFATYPTIYGERLAHWDEVWTPSRFARESIAARTRLPVRWVPPPIAARAELTDLDPALLEARFRADDPHQLDDPWTLFAALRELARREPSLSWRLELRISGLDPACNAASPSFELLAALREECSGLPVDLQFEGYETLSASRAGIRIALHRTGEFRPELVAALFEGRCLVGTDYGARADLLDASTGYVVPYRLRAHGASLGPVAGSGETAVNDAGALAAVLIRALREPAERRALAASGRARALQLHAPASAARTWFAELDRIRDLLTGGS